MLQIHRKVKNEEAEQAELKKRDRLRELAMINLEAATERMRQLDQEGKDNEAAEQSELALGWFQSLTGT